MDQQGNFYFIEVNARIQVEHPVTEMVTGIDLIKAQIRVAAGEPLPSGQAEVGPAARPSSAASTPKTRPTTSPSPGKISGLSCPAGSGVRLDSHVHAGYAVSPHYDSLVGKLIVHQPTRGQAIACMRRALDELNVEGVQTTIPLHREILSHPAFVEGRVDTTFIERTWLS